MKSLLCSLIVAMSIFSFSASAEQKIVKGNWDIRYIAFPSGFLEPEVANQYGLQRSKYMAVINISVLDNQNNDKAQNVHVFGHAKNLLGQTKELTFTKVTEGDAIYYLAQLKYRNEEMAKFTITAQLGDRQETIQFEKKLYVD